MYLVIIMGRDIKLIVGSESPLCVTGYGIVMYNLLPELAKLGYDIEMIGWQYNGRALELPSLGIKHLHAHGLTSFEDPYFPTKLPLLIKWFKPDAYLSLIDIFHTQGMIQHCKKANLPYINYFPVDAIPFWVGWLDHIEESTLPLTLSKFGKGVIEKCVKRYVNKAWAKTFSIDYLWHGVDTKKYHPLAEQKIDELRKTLNTSLKLPDDTFYYLFVGRNIQRKQVPRLMEAFKIVNDRYPKTRLLLKIGSPRDSHGYYLPEIELRFGLRGKMFYVDQTENPLEGIDEKEMNEWYNVAHVHVSATSGEGFGLTTLEAMAAGKANIITDYSTSEELIGRDKDAKGWLVPVQDHFIGNHYNARRALVSIQGLASAMIEAYEDREKLTRYGRKAYHFAQKFTWKDIAKQMDGHIRKVVEERVGK